MESSVRRLRVDGALLRHLLVRELVMIGLLLITGVTVARVPRRMILLGRLRMPSPARPCLRAWAIGLYTAAP
ncbi:hypothetical protein WSS_A14799 [Rhodococcus opacus M213]|uniref:Uncharacterized protein n=1 Tax=Rhodococcus opacus M213 TaxID=1129896 RepID=K8XUQ4_RHOOP|nr:hypothetical protein WSS_A14799 [Rhodococcus opacus M213]